MRLPKTHKGDVFFDDLIGTPWARMRCGALASEVLRRIGFPIPEHAGGVDLGARLKDEEVARVLDYLNDGSTWSVVGSKPSECVQLGDVAVWDARPAPHVGVLVSERFRLILTTAAHGGAYASAVGSFPVNGCKVYRWNGRCA